MDFPEQHRNILISESDSGTKQQHQHYNSTNELYQFYPSCTSIEQIEIISTFGIAWKSTRRYSDAKKLFQSLPESLETLVFRGNRLETPLDFDFPAYFSSFSFTATATSRFARECNNPWALFLRQPLSDSPNPPGTWSYYPDQVSHQQKRRLETDTTSSYGPKLLLHATSSCLREL